LSSSKLNKGIYTQTWRTVLLLLLLYL